MTQRNTRTRTTTPRKNRVWTTSPIDLAISAGGTAGQQFDVVSSSFIAKVGRALARGDTLAHSWLKGVWTQSAAGDSSFERLYLGLGFYPTQIGASEFPDLSDHDGDWQMHDARGFREGVTVQAVFIPSELAAVNIESAGQRMVPRSGDDYRLSMVGQSDNNPSAGSFEFSGALTLLWLT